MYCPLLLSTFLSPPFIMPFPHLFLAIHDSSARYTMLISLVFLSFFRSRPSRQFYLMLGMLSSISFSDPESLLKHFCGVTNGLEYILMAGIVSRSLQIFPFILEQSHVFRTNNEVRMRNRLRRFIFEIDKALPTSCRARS